MVTIEKTEYYMWTKFELFNFKITNKIGGLKLYLFIF